MKELDIVQDLHNVSVQSVFILFTLSIFGVYTKHFGAGFCVSVHAELGTYLIGLSEIVAVTAHCVLSIKSRSSLMPRV